MNAERKSHPEKDVERAVHKRTVNKDSELSAGAAILRRKWKAGAL